MLLSNCSAHASVDILEYLVGRDLAPGEYAAELYQTEEDALIGIAVCTILRPSKDSYTVKTIQTDDMTLTASHPVCTIDLLEGDQLMVGCSEGYTVRLTNLSGTEIADQYPGAVEGVNLTQAINVTLAYIDKYAFYFDGLKDAAIEYDATMPSINITLYYSLGDKQHYAEHLPAILWKLNDACVSQNPQIADPTPKSNGGLYEEIAVVVGVYDDAILYTDSAFDTYYILPGATDLIEHQ